MKTKLRNKTINSVLNYIDYTKIRDTILKNNIKVIKNNVSSDLFENTVNFDSQAWNLDLALSDAVHENIVSRCLYE